jgi:hypothetical protein
MRAVPFGEVELEFSAFFHKLAVIVTRRDSTSKSQVLSRLRALLEEGVSGTEPDGSDFSR